MRFYLSRMLAKERCPARKPFAKIVWSWLGSFLGILGVGLLGRASSINESNLVFLIGSFGASAVLVYGAPLAEFSQPRNLVGGHFVCALVGVSVFVMVGDNPLLSAPLAVSLSVVAMHFTRTLHPPGGATALIAVIGGASVNELGFLYAFAPVLVSSLVLLIVALVVNNLSSNPKRHYPVYWI